MFRKFKPRWTQAQLNAKRLLKQQSILNDVGYISDLKNRADRGLQLYTEIQKLSRFVNEKTSDQINKYLAFQETEPLSSVLYRMKDSLKDFDELVFHDKKRRELLTAEVELQNRWNNAHSSVTRLINQSNAQNNNEFLNYLRSKVEKGHFGIPFISLY
jgi:hypothetical protein